MGNRRLLTSTVCGLLGALTLTGCAAIRSHTSAKAKPDPLAQPREFHALRFAPDKVPRIDGDFADWASVPESCWITTADMRHDWKKDRLKDVLRVCIGYCAETARLYFAVYVDDNYLKADQYRSPSADPYYPFIDDIFEVVVDADRSGDDFVYFKKSLTPEENRRLCGCHAQNYHIYLVTPPETEHAWLWGDQKWLLGKPYAEWAHQVEGKPGGPARIRLEFYITPFNYASPDGPEGSARAVLTPGSKIGIGWLRLDDEFPDKTGRKLGDCYFFGSKLELYKDADDCYDVTMDP